MPFGWRSTRGVGRRPPAPESLLPSSHRPSCQIIMIVVAPLWSRRPRPPGDFFRLLQEIPLPFLVFARISRLSDGSDSENRRRGVDRLSEGAQASLGVHKPPREHRRRRLRGGHPRPIDGCQRCHLLHYFRRWAARDATHHAGVLRHIGVDGGRIRWKSTGATCMKTTIMKSTPSAPTLSLANSFRKG